MAYAPFALACRHRRSANRRPQGRFFARFLAALAAARQHDAEREIARFLSTSGGKFTDDTEREIERRFLASRRAGEGFSRTNFGDLREMSTLPLRPLDLPHVPNFWSGFARVGAAFVRCSMCSPRPSGAHGRAPAAVRSLSRAPAHQTTAICNCLNQFVMELASLRRGCVTNLPEFPTTSRASQKTEAT